MAVISQAVVMISLLCERRALLTEFPSTTYLSFWECPTQRQQLYECLEKECILFSQRSELQVQEGKWSVVPLRTSDCETIFSFLFLRGLEETPVTGAKAVVRTHWNRIKNHTFPSSPFHLTVIFYCCYSAAFYTPENHELSKQTGRCWQPQKKNTMAGRRLRKEDGDCMGRRGCPWSPCTEKRRKISCKGKRTNNPMKESKTELPTHISKGGNCLSQPKTGPLFMS